MDIDVGSEIGSYVLETRLGGGGFGSVWRARSRHDGRPVAIKLLTGALSSGDNASLRAEVELLAATASSKSPHVVRVLGGVVFSALAVIYAMLAWRHSQCVTPVGTHAR